ncbi:unnamed protein product [Linum trigynum]|uniref:Reverse transcriptase domain-containing protein n=1 Tax=Linum trigynum TaxID=586398 RepID=A0AAV2FA57_9ROSI
MVKATVSLDYFHWLFSSNGMEPQGYVDHLRLPRVISAAMNEALVFPVSREEIKRAVFSIGASQAPGPDGFTDAFFQNFWDVVGTSVCSVVLSFCRIGHLLHSINHTWITLIPKVPNAKSMKQLRPISLCQVIYKIIAKILAGRLSSILSSVVSPFQNEFIKGRVISDNILIGQEVMSFLKTKVQGRDKWMALKLDMEKGYDRVEWKFLFAVLAGLGFFDKWLCWIKGCVTSVHYSVLMNSVEYGYFQPHRGIRQGDPLSPLLFALFIEAFSAKLCVEIASSSLHGLRIHRCNSQLARFWWADQDKVKGIHWVS